MLSIFEICGLAGIGEIGEHKVDLPVASAEGQGRDGALVGQVAQRAVIDAGKDPASCMARISSEPMPETI